MLYRYIPKELINIILDYDGRIKYEKGKYINIIHKYDYKYNIIEPIINNKIKVFKNVEIFSKNKFYFDINFDKYKYMGLIYDYSNYKYYDETSDLSNNILKICFYNLKYNNIIQIKSYF